MSNDEEGEEFWAVLEAAQDNLDPDASDACICGTKMTGIQYSLLYKAPFYSKYDNFSIGKISFQCIPTGISVGGFCKSGTL
jgi:hypothetical protein